MDATLPCETTWDRADFLPLPMPGTGPDRYTSTPVPSDLSSDLSTFISDTTMTDCSVLSAVNTTQGTPDRIISSRFDLSGLHSGSPRHTSTPVPVGSVKESLCERISVTSHDTQDCTEQVSILSHSLQDYSEPLNSTAQYPVASTPVKTLSYPTRRHLVRRLHLFTTLSDLSEVTTDVSSASLLTRSSSPSESNLITEVQTVERTDSAYTSTVLRSSNTSQVDSDASTFLEKPLYRKAITRLPNLDKLKKRTLISRMKRFTRQFHAKNSSMCESFTTMAVL